MTLAKLTEYAGGSEQASSALNSLVGALNCILAQAEFILAWQTIHDVVATNTRILMFWSPNVETVENVTGWWPEADYVDIFGMDNYPDPGATFASSYGAFYDNSPTSTVNISVLAKPARTRVGRLRIRKHGSHSLQTPMFLPILATNLPHSSSLKKELIFVSIQGQSDSTIRETLSKFA